MGCDRKIFLTGKKQTEQLVFVNVYFIFVSREKQLGGGGRVSVGQGSCCRRWCCDRLYGIQHEGNSFNKFYCIHTYMQTYIHTVYCTYISKGSNVTVCPFVVQASYLRYTYLYTYIHTVKITGIEGGVSIYCSWQHTCTCHVIHTYINAYKHKYCRNVYCTYVHRYIHISPCPIKLTSRNGVGNGVGIQLQILGDRT